MSSEELAEIVLDQAVVDQQLAYRLLAGAMAASGQSLDLREWKKRVTAAFRGRGGFIEWRHAAEWGRGVHEMLEVVESFLGAGHASEVATLAEHAHKRAESAINRVDDSGGEITVIIGVIRELHLAAAEAGAYPPKKLGKRLAELETTASLDTFHRSAIDYADVLGEDGLDAYLAAIDKAEAKLESPNDRWGPAFHVRQARIAHAIATRDPDRLIDIYDGDDRMHADNYVEIVELLGDVGRRAEAEAWAERGLDELATGLGIRSLRNAYAALLKQNPERAHEVEELYWRAFMQGASQSSLDDLLANSGDRDAAIGRVIETLDDAIAHVRNCAC